MMDPSSGAGAGDRKEISYRPFQIKILAATFLTYVGYYFCRRPFYVAKSAIASEFAFTSIDIAHLGTAYLTAYMVGQFSSAYFGRRLGPKLLLVAGMAVSIGSGVLFGLSNSFWTMMLFLALNGLAQGTGWPGCIGSLAYWFKRKQRGTILGFWATCYQVGQVAATFAASYLLGQAGWRWSFYGGSMILLFIWAIVLLLHPGTPEKAGLPPVEDDGESDPGAETPKQALGWDRDVIITILMMGMIYFCLKFLRYSLWSWLPWFLEKNYHLARDTGGYYSTVFDICGLAGVIASGYVSDRVFKGRRAFLSFMMMSIMTLSFLVMYLGGSASLAVFTVSVGVAGFMLFGPDSLISGVGAIDVGSRRGALSAAGIINGMGSIGPIFQEEAIGWMYNRYSHDLVPILILLVLVAAASVLLMLVLWRRSVRGNANL